jgi:hypothetical protein
MSPRSGPGGIVLLGWDSEYQNREGCQATFNGQRLPLVLLSALSNYGVFGANVGAFAGQTGQLLFTAPAQSPASYAYLDDIGFYSSAVPEPSVLALFGLDGLVLAASMPRRRA